MSEKIRELRYEHKKAEKFFAKRLAYTLGPVELKQMIDENKVKILDVRKKEDFDASHLPSAISMPYDILKEKISELSNDEIYVVYCYNALCHLGDRACYRLAEAEKTVMLLEGGFKSWTEDFRFATVTEE